MLLSATETWLREKGMDPIRGPQNFPINDAIPGLMTDGFSSRPVVYYGYSKPYYRTLLVSCGFNPGMRIFSWEIPVTPPMEEKLERIAMLSQKRRRCSAAFRTFPNGWRRQNSSGDSNSFGLSECFLLREKYAGSVSDTSRCGKSTAIWAWRRSCFGNRKYIPRPKVMNTATPAGYWKPMSRLSTLSR